MSQYISSLSTDSASALGPALAPPAYTPECTRQAKCEELSPPSYSMIDTPVITFSLKLSFSSSTLRSVDMHDQLDIRSVENNLPLYILNKCHFDNITTSFALTNSFTNLPIMKATKDIRNSNDFSIQKDSSSDTTVLRSASIFRFIYKFTWKNHTFRWSLDGKDLVCVLQSVDPKGRRIYRSVGGVEFIDSSNTKAHREKNFGKLWIFQREVSDIIKDSQFEAVFLITSALVMEQAGLLKI
ncbi:hypothetical protein K7432_005236 [Basidiobolus ranarum]|uniref:Uncharacterized protein n=1 Tax=Basidiobolus ranarum TaxID=34480 RepID=A0ABR2WWU4_9FUNG